MKKSMKPESIGRVNLKRVDTTTEADIAEYKAGDDANAIQD